MNFILIFTLKCMVLLGMFNLVPEPEMPKLNYAEEQINQIRKENGLSELKVSNCLRERAKLRLNEVQELWSHTRPNGKRSYTAKDCGGVLQGENLAKDSVSIEIAIQAWLNSPTHKEVLFSNVNSIGIASYDGYYVMEVNR